MPVGQFGMPSSKPNGAVMSPTPVLSAVFPTLLGIRYGDRSLSTVMLCPFRCLGGVHTAHESLMCIRQREVRAPAVVVVVLVAARNVASADAHGWPIDSWRRHVAPSEIMRTQRTRINEFGSRQLRLRCRQPCSAIPLRLHGRVRTEELPALNLDV